MMLFFVVVLLSIGLTWCVLLISRRFQWLDLPTDRSAHSAPTPRGGGVSIVVIFLCVTLILMQQNLLPALPWVLIIFAVGMVTIIGLIDDFKSASVLSRLIIQFLAIVLVLSSLLMKSSGAFGDWSVTFQYAVFVLALLCGVWCINLYNFMDGIDGIAGLQAFFMSVVMSFLFYVEGWSGLAVLTASLAAASLGFLFWNFPKARIFMGDSGSGGLGIIFFALALWSSYHKTGFLALWLIVFAVFITDASLTLITRYVTGQKVLSAHNLHCYQKLTQKAGSHARVSFSVMFVNFFWLAPLTLMTYFQLIPAWVGLLLAYSPLLIFCLKMKAGVKAVTTIPR